MENVKMFYIKQYNVQIIGCHFSLILKIEIGIFRSTKLSKFLLEIIF